jgi:tRNA dimethylallyltransferase
VPNDRAVLHERIALRFDQMLEAGFLDEVRALLVKYPTLTQNATSMRCVGYRQALEHLAGDYDLAELRDRGIFATRQLAKRQLTWLRGMADSLELDCLQSGLQNQVLQVIKEHL